MALCNSCGGVLGRDCFNPVECAQIGFQIEQEKHHQQQSLAQRVEIIEEELMKLRSQISDLRFL